MSETPTELLTFLIADVRGYTRFTQERGDEAAAQLATRFATVIEEEVKSFGGWRVELRGDEALAAFRSARKALRAAVALQERFSAEVRSNPDMPLEVGIGLDAGEAVRADTGGYRGEALNLAARLCSVAASGEVLASAGVVHLARKIEGLDYIERGRLELKGFAEPIGVVHVTATAETGPPDLDLEGLPDGVSAALPVGGFLGAQPEGDLVARQEEVERLRTSVESVAAGTGQLVMLAGEPGVGKTRLVQEIGLNARRRGFLLVAGSCFESRQTVPYYPFTEALAALAASCSPSVRAEIPRQWRPLARLLPDRSIPLPAPGADGQNEPERLFWAVTEFVRACAEAAPVALMLDDLHWADRSSLELLHHLARHTRNSRLLLLGTYRDIEIDREHPLDRVLLEMHRQHLIELVPVKRLDQAGTAALVEQALAHQPVSPEFVGRLHDRTEGNPFFTQELLRALVERGDLPRRNGQWTGDDIKEMEVPERIRAIVGQRLARLAGPTQEILREASVLGQTFSFDDVQAVGAREEDDVERALEEALAAGLVRAAGRDDYAFNHALTQQSLYGEIPPRRRRRLHLAAAQALERLPEAARERRAAEIAWHALQGDDSRRALSYAVLAAERAEAVFAHHEAERLYRLALETARQLDATEDGAAVREEAGILEKLGATLQTQGRTDEAWEMLERAAQTYTRLHDLDGERRTVAQIGLVESQRGRPKEGLARLQPLLEQSDGAKPTPGLALLYVALAQLHTMTGSYKASMAAAERATDLAGELGDKTILAEAEVRRGEALVFLGDTREGRRVLERVVQHVESENFAPLTQALNAAGTACFRAGDFLQSRMYHARARDLAERTGDARSTLIATLALADVFFYLGDWKQTRRLIQRAAESIDRGAMTDLAASHAILLGRLQLVEGNEREATRLLEEGAALAERDGDMRRFLWAQKWLAEKEILEGRPEAACNRLEPLIALPGVDALGPADLNLTLARAYLSSGDEPKTLRRSESLVVVSIEGATSVHSRPEFFEALWALGLIRTHQARFAEAQRLLEGALSLVRAMPYPFGEAAVLCGVAAMLEQSQRPAEARDRLQAALVIYRRLGAGPYLRRVEERLEPLPREVESGSAG